MFKISFGNILDSKADVLVNTVNCVGVMGKGIAKEFKEKYPNMFNDYVDRCNNKQVTPGKPYVFRVDNKRSVINFPTKDHWRSPSKIQYIEDGLNWFINNYEQLNIKSIAFPPLGCGNGGLSWEEVGPLMFRKLNLLPIDIEVYPPYGISRSKTTIDFLSKTNTVLSKNSSNKINNNWLLALEIVKTLNDSPYSVKVGRIVFQKICYILTRNGTNLGLNFVQGEYGPYCKDIYKMITILSNNNLVHEKSVNKSILMEVTDNFVFDYDLYNNNDIENMKKTCNLFKRIQSAKQAELITTIIYSFDIVASANKDIVDDKKVLDYILNWKNRYNNDYQIEQIEELMLSLTDMKLINVKFHDRIENVGF